MKSLSDSRLWNICEWQAEIWSHKAGSEMTLPCMHTASSTDGANRHALHSTSFFRLHSCSVEGRFVSLPRNTQLETESKRLCMPWSNGLVKSRFTLRTPQKWLVSLNSRLGMYCTGELHKRPWALFPSSLQQRMSHLFLQKEHSMLTHHTTYSHPSPTLWEHRKLPTVDTQHCPLPSLPCSSMSSRGKEHLGQTPASNKLSLALSHCTCMNEFLFHSPGHKPASALV